MKTSDAMPYRLRWRRSREVFDFFYNREAAIGEMWRAAEEANADVDIERRDDDGDWVDDGGTHIALMYPSPVRPSPPQPL